jgi:hypothetical protein
MGAWQGYQRPCRSPYAAAVCRRALPPTARSDARFCSPACRAQARRTEARALVAKTRSTYDSPEPCRCERCGEPVSPMMWDYRREDARFCSSRCRQAAHRQRHAGAQPRRT